MQFSIVNFVDPFLALHYMKMLPKTKITD